MTSSIDAGQSLQRLIEAEEFRELLLLGTLVLHCSEAERRQLEAKRKNLEAEGLQLLKQARQKMCPNTTATARRPAGSSQVEAWYDDARFAVEALLDIAWRQFSGHPQWPYSDAKALAPKEQTVREFQRRLRQIEEAYANLALGELPPKQILWLYDYCISVFPHFMEGETRTGRVARELPEVSKLPIPQGVYAPKRARASVHPLWWFVLLGLVLALAGVSQIAYVKLRANRTKSTIEKVVH